MYSDGKKWTSSLGVIHITSLCSLRVDDTGGREERLQYVLSCVFSGCLLNGLSISPSDLNGRATYRPSEFKLTMKVVVRLSEAIVDSGNL